MKRSNIIIFGGTGDLTKRKLIPALTELIHEKILDNNSTIVGISRKDFTDEGYKGFLKEGIENDEKKYFDEVDVKYLQIDFSKESEIKKLLKILAKCDIEGCNNIFYLATSYKFFPGIVKGLKNFGFHESKNGFTRIIFEKPFGNDLKSSCKLDEDIHKVFSEEQVFRIDHYLAKESVVNIRKFKLDNNKFWKLMNYKNVNKIRLVVDEVLGVGNRINYYNDSGAIKDMFQNHLLQVLSILLMEKGKEVGEFHKNKVEVLKKIRVLGGLLGQYKNYKEELKIVGLKDKKIETFVKLDLICRSDRWKGVPIEVRTGKMLKRKYGQIIIDFNKEIGKIIINLSPSQDIQVIEGSKKFGICNDCNFSPNTVDEYKVLLGEAIKGNKVMFADDKEVKESWKIVDEVIKMKKKFKFVIYEKGDDPEGL